MARLKIGEALLDKGLITPEQLSTALRDQEILGGHLGTCLIELGFVAEEPLGRTLSELLNMRYASWEVLSGVPDEVIRALPVKLVAKYSVIPILVEDRSLHVATVAPRTLSALSKETGMRIIPWVAPEIRILQAMEMHYGLPMQPRYIKLRDQLDAQQIETQSEMPQTDDGNDEEDWIAPPVEEGAEAGEGFGYGRSWREIADQQFAETHDAVATEPAVAIVEPLTVDGGDSRTADDRIALDELNAEVDATLRHPPRTSHTASTSDGLVRGESLDRIAGLLRVRMSVDDELARLGFPLDRVSAIDGLTCWIACTVLDLESDPDDIGLALDEAGNRYRIVRTRDCPEHGCLIEVPLVPRVDFFIAVDLDDPWRVRGILRASFEALVAAGKMRGGECRVAWDVLDRQGTGIEILTGELSDS